MPYSALLTQSSAVPLHAVKHNGNAVKSKAFVAPEASLLSANNGNDGHLEKTLRKTANLIN